MGTACRAAWLLSASATQTLSAIKIPPVTMPRSIRTPARASGPCETLARRSVAEFSKALGLGGESRRRLETRTCPYGRTARKCTHGLVLARALLHDCDMASRSIEEKIRWGFAAATLALLLVLAASY